MHEPAGPPAERAAPERRDVEQVGVLEDEPVDHLTLQVVEVVEVAEQRCDRDAGPERDLLRGRWQVTLLDEPDHRVEHGDPATLAPGGPPVDVLRVGHAEHVAMPTASAVRSARGGDVVTSEQEWIDLGRRAALASHRLVGWIFWDPGAIERYAALGVPNGAGYYIASRAAPLAVAGNQAVVAAFGSIHPLFVGVALDLCRTHTTFAAAAEVRDAAVLDGLSEFAPEVLDGLGELAGPLWAAADALPVAGRVLFAAHREWPRPEHAALSAWLAINCIREWRGDTHWAIQVAEGLSTTASGLLDGAWRAYEDDWLPRSRGADDGMIAAAMAELEQRGLAHDGRIDQRGIVYRQQLEDRLEAICVAPWQHLGADLTLQFLELVEPAGQRLMARVDATAGPNWMPAGRDRRAPLDGRTGS